MPALREMQQLSTRAKNTLRRRRNKKRRRGKYEEFGGHTNYDTKESKDKDKGKGKGKGETKKKVKWRQDTY